MSIINTNKTKKNKKSYNFNLSGSNSKYNFELAPDGESTAKFQLSTPDGKYFADVGWGLIDAIQNGNLYGYQPKSEEEKNAITNFINHKGYSLTTENGIDFGKVSYGAYNALTKGDIDTYTPIDEEEESVIENYKKEPTIPLETNVDGKKISFGTVSYNGFQSIKNGTYDKYTPVNESEKKAINDFVSYSKQEYKNKLIAENPNLKPYFDLEERYGIDLLNFDIGSLGAIAPKLNHDVSIDSNFVVRLTPKYKGGFLGIGGTKLSTEQQDKDAKALLEVLKDNANSRLSKTKLGKFMLSLQVIPYTAEKLASGISGGVEDFFYGGAALVGKGMTTAARAIDKITPGDSSAFGNMLENKTKDILASQTVGDRLNEDAETRFHVPEWYRQYVGNTVQAFGNLLPAMATEYFTGGVSPYGDMAIAKMVGQTATKKSLTNTIKTSLKTIRESLTNIKPSDIVFGGGAMGSASRRAYAETGDVDKSLNYGVLNGLGEVFTEKLFGGLGGTGLGSGGSAVKSGNRILKVTDVADDLIDLSKIKGISKLASTKYGKKVLNVALEGVEEMIMTGLDPWMQRATINPDAKSATLKEYGESALQGILLSTFSNVATYSYEKIRNIPTIKELNVDIQKVNDTLPDGVAKLKPLKKTASNDEIVARATDVQRIKGINAVNRATDTINTMMPLDQFEPLTYDATIEDIKERQKQIGVFASAYADVMVEELVNNNPEAFAFIERISIGDKFVDAKTGYKVTVTNRDANNTTVSIDTGVKTITRVFTNSQIDAFAKSEQMIEVDDSAVTEPTTTEADTIAVGDTFASTGTGNIATVVGRDANNTTMQVVKSDKVETVTMSNDKLNKFVSDGQLTKIDSAESTPSVADTTEVTTKADEPIRDINLKRVGRFYEAYGEDALLLAEALDGVETTKAVVNGVETDVLRLPADLAEKAVSAYADEFNLILSDKPTSTEVENATVTDETTTSDETIPTEEESATEVEISDVANAIEETLTEQAKADLQNGEVKDNYIRIAETLMEVYKADGTIEAFADFFVDGGKKVEATIKGETDNSIEVLKNEATSDTINSSNENDSVERKDDSNERRSDSLSGDSRRGYNGSARKQAERISYFERENQGRDATERQNFTRELTERGQIEEVTVGRYKYILIKPEAYNDDMLSMVEEAKKKGVELQFIVGKVRVAFDTKDEFTVRGLKLSSSKVVVQYDNAKSPQKIAKHEIIHAKWNTPEIQAIKDTILNSLTVEDKQDILSQDRYSRYMEMYKGDENAVLEEFVCDVMSGMTYHMADHIDMITDYWYGNEAIEGYDAADYATSKDAGGKYDIDEKQGDVKNGINESATMSENDERYSKMQTRESSKTVQNRSFGEPHTKPGKVDKRSRHQDIQRRTPKIEKRKIEEVCEEKRFVHLSRFIGNGISISMYNTLERSYIDDERLDIYGFSDVITHDMLSDETNNLRNLFSDEISEYFNGETLLSNQDITGEYVSDEILEKTKGTVIVNDSGHLIPIYHATPTDFVEFKSGDVGIHAGSFYQAVTHAQNRVKHLNEPKDMYMIKAYGVLRNPIKATYGDFNWSAKDCLQVLVKAGALSHEKSMYFFERANADNASATIELREYLVDEGYDGIIYENNIESTAGTSYILFDNSQIIQLGKEKFNVDDYNSDVNDDARYDLDDYTIDEILKWTPEQFDKAYEALGLDKFTIEDDILLEDFELTDADIEETHGGDFTIDDISEELDVEPEKIEILVRRKGLGSSHIEENRTAVMTSERINRDIKDSGASNPTYAQRYITRISPKDFIDLTVMQNNMDRKNFDTRVEGDSGSTMGDVDYLSALSNSEQTPYLCVDRTTGKIIGHNGRHRIRALEMSGIESVEIEVELYEDGKMVKYNAETIPDMAISSQYDTAIETHISNIIPLNESHRDEIERTYGEKAHTDAGVRYDLDDRDNEYMKAVESGDTETVAKMIEDAAEKSFPNSKVRGDDGKLKLVYHGRVSDFNVFDRQFANIEGDFGKGYYFTSNEYDVDANYANEEGPDLKNKIDRYAEQLEYNEEYEDLSYEERQEIARQKFITSEPNTITAYLNMENPVYITPDEKGTFLDYNESYDEEYDEYGEPEGLLIDFIEALNSIASDYSYRDVDFNFLYEYGMDNGGMYAADAVKTIKNRIIDELSDDEGNIATNEVIRLAFEEIGFDGIIDSSVYYKFRNMDGMDSGTTHYIVFDSEQIKSADLVTYDDDGNVIPISERFNKNNKDIRYDIDSKNNLETQKKIEKIAKEINTHDELIEVAKKNTQEFVDKIKENKSLQKRLDNAKRQTLLSPKPIINVAQVGKVTKDILKEMDSTLKATDLKDEIISIYTEYFDNMKKASGVESKVQEANDNMMKRFANLAIDIAESAEAYAESEEYLSLKAYLKDVRIKVPDHAKGEAHFGEFRKSHMGTFNLTNDGLDIDTVYQELCEMFPGMFDVEVANAVDQLYAIADKVEALKPYAYNPHLEYMAEAVDHIVYRFASEVDGIAATPKTKAQKIAEKGAYDKEMALEKERASFERKLDRHKKNSEKTIQALQKKIGDSEYVRYWEKRLSKEEKAQAVNKVREKQKVAVLKTQIRNIVADMKKKLDKTEKNGGYPKELVKAVADVCSVIDFHTDRTNKDGTPTKASLKLDALKMQYDALKNSPNYDFQTEYSDEISNRILKLHQKIENKRVVDLTFDELSQLKEILGEINHSLATASEQIGKANTKANYEIATDIINDLHTNNKSISEFKNSLLREMKLAKEKGKAFTINPHRIFEMLSNYDKNSALWQLYDQINRGARASKKFTMDATLPFDELTDGGGNEIAFYDFRTKLHKTGIKFEDGTDVEIPKSIICEIVMLWDRKQGRTHLEAGGFKIPDLKLFNKGQTAESLAVGKKTNAITQADITRLKGMLDSYDKAWIERSRHLFNNVAKNAINETSMQLLGREIAKADNYIRIYVDSDFVNKDIGKNENDITIEGHGSLKETTPDAKNPVVLRGLHENVFEHIDFASRYYGLAIPIRNFNKVYKISIKDGDSSQSIRSMLGSTFGPKIRDGVVVQVIKDLQSPRPREISMFNKVRGKWLTSVFWGNIKSTLKQTTSYWTSSSILDESSLIKGLGSYIAHRKQTKAEIAKYSGTLYNRSQGLSTTELGDRANRKRLAGLSSKTTKFINEKLPVLRKVPEWIRPGNWLQSMDCATSSALWDACKHQVSKTMNESEEGYMKAVADLYERVIEETQSNYDMLHRPEILKSTNPVNQTLGMFQNDNLQQTGIMYGAFNNLRVKQKAYKADKSSVNEQNLKDAKKRMDKAIRSRIYSSMWLVLVSTLGDALLRKFKPYIDDEDKEITSSSVLEQAMLNMAEDTFGIFVPVYGQLVTKAVDTFNEGYDFLNDPSFDVMEDFIKATSKIWDAYAEDGDVLKALVDAVPAISNMTGIPAKNISDLYKSVKGYIGDIKEGELAHDLEDYTSGNKSFYSYSDLASYIASGDKEKETKWNEYYSANGKEFAKGNLTKEIKPAYVQMYLDSPEKAYNIKKKLILDYDYTEADINDWFVDEYLKHIVPGKKFDDKSVSNPEYAAEIKDILSKGNKWDTTSTYKAIRSYYKDVYKDGDEKEIKALRDALTNSNSVSKNILSQWESEASAEMKKQENKLNAEKEKFKD